MGAVADSGSSLTYSKVIESLRSFYSLSLRSYTAAIGQAITNDPDLCSSREYVEALYVDQLLGSSSSVSSFTR